MPYAQRPFGSTYLVVRTAADPGAVASSVRQAILALEPTTGISDVRPLERVVSDAVAQPRFRMWLLLLLAGLAAAMAAVGLYGVIEHSVSQRLAEIGVRLALGATRADILLMVLRQGLTLIATGLVVGVAGAYGLSRTLAVFLYGVGATDMVSFASAAAFIIMVGVMASLVPARRATAVDPMVVLRNS
jgi:putative ABC transport system permease protein